MTKDELQALLGSTDPGKNKIALSYLKSKGGLGDLQAIMAFVKATENIEFKKEGIHIAADLIRANLLTHYPEIKPKMRKSLTLLLGSLDHKVVDTIAEDLKSDHEDTRFHAICILGLMGKNPRTRELLENMVGDRNEKVRATAISLMRALIDSKDIRLITAMLRDNDHRVVANVIEVIESTDLPQLIPALNKYKFHPNNRVRGNALKALWNLGRADIYKPLLEMIEDDQNYLMRTSGCWVIGELFSDTDYEYMAMVEPCLQDKEKLVRENAIKAYLKIGGDVFQKLSALANPIEVQEVKKWLDQQ